MTFNFVKLCDTLALVCRSPMQHYDPNKFQNFTGNQNVRLGDPV